jgi:3-hydroxyacyl-[acyl-carrier-protein] dehydratase
LFVEPGADYLQDHFPGDPMLPGLVMLEAAVRAATTVWPADGNRQAAATALDRVERLHVMRRVVPGETLVVTAELTDPGGDEFTRMFKAIGLVAGQTAMRATFRLRLLEATADPGR